MATPIIIINMHPSLQRLAQKAVLRYRIASWCVEIVRSRAVSSGFWQGLRLFDNVKPENASLDRRPPELPSGRLRAYFDSHREGNGIDKWNHYFGMYERHLAKFVNREVNICEIGVFSGGSLEMWRHYFGDDCKVFGVDIEPVCKTYENAHVKILIGDQADRRFWKSFREEVPALDIVIDDGGHTVEQQIVTLEETLPYLRPCGVFICEDIHGMMNEFAHYVSGLALSLNADRNFQGNEDQERSITVTTNSLQSAIRSVSIYPFAVVIERNDAPISELTSAKRGTSWQPFFQAPSDRPGGR
ncbi:MAG: class I SAM-dependent methyltransferase [Acidobacteriaceae bacterium]